MNNPHTNPMHTGTSETHSSMVHLPAPTASPFMMALGATIIGASLVTSTWLLWLGIPLFIAAAVGWFREVLPHEKHEEVHVAVESFSFTPVYDKVARIRVDETHRAQLPLHTFPISSGIKGGIAGGIAMVIPAEIYGVVRYHSIWYVVNLLGGAGVGTWTNPTVEQMSTFHMSAFLTANIIQGATTLLVGILYGALLPIWPRRPILLGGLIAPIAWTGLLHSVLGLVNPYFAEHIDWWSFAASQVIFGVVAGYVVARTGHLQKLRQVPLALRLGIESPGLQPDREQDDGDADRR
jgi:hypothetical protein